MQLEAFDVGTDRRGEIICGCQNWTGGGAYLEPELTEEGEYFGVRTDRRRWVFGCQN